MTRIAKLYAQVAANPRVSLSFRDFIRLLSAFGFVEVRQRGSHKVFEHRDAYRPLIVQPRGNEAKSYQVIEFLDMIEEHRLTMDDR